MGIGRELYTAPFICVPAGKCRIQKNREKYATPDRFSVKEISYNGNREIAGLKIVNQKGMEVYSMKSPAPLAGEMEPPLKEEWMEEFQKELDRTGVALDAVLKRYGISSEENMTSEIYDRAMRSLKRTKTKAA